jgi:hypothetical protein
MRLIKQTEEYVVDSEEEAIRIIKNFKDAAASNGYILGESGYKYRTKKAKGEIIGEVWVCKITKILGGVWDDYE